MSPKRNLRISKFLSCVLRHQPSEAFVSLDPAGWVPVETLLVGLARAGKFLTREDLEQIVATNSKRRFEFSYEGGRIRACQGHTVEVDFDLPPQTPPEVLYHGTATRHLGSIREQGLLRMQRHHVHLSTETKVTMQVASRQGNPVLLRIQAGEMHRAGHVFFCTSNDVWLVDHVPASFIQFP